MGVTNATRRGRLALLGALAATLILAAAPVQAWADTPPPAATTTQKATPAQPPATPKPTAPSSSTQAKGIDVSTWNGVIDWIRVASNGYRFVFGKATEGITLTDPTYSINRAGTEGFGLRFGAYHFARPGGSSVALRTANAIAQADHFIDVAEPAQGELPPVLDLEKTGGLEPTSLQQWLRAWMNEVYARTGLHASVYASPLFWKNAVANTTDFASGGSRLWVAHWTKGAKPLVPAQNWGGLGWTWWQWTDCSLVPGFAHCSDGDRMNGPDPGAAAIPAYPTGTPAVVTAPTVVGSPAVHRALAAIPGVWSGGKPVSFAYAWQSCDAAGANCAPIPGATNAKYVPVAADAGHSLVVSITATTPAGAATATTAPTAAIAGTGAQPGVRPAVVTAPLVDGTAQIGQQLTAQAGTWSGSPTAFAYGWLRCDAGGANCVPISGATASTYTVSPDDVGATIALAVTAKGRGGVTSTTTAATGIVVAAPLPPLATGSQTAQPGVGGNVQMEDGRAVVTWQPGAVPDGLQMIIAPFTGTLSIPGSEIAIGVAKLGPGGFPWPVDIAYTTPQPPGTVLGYSNDAKLYAPVPALTGPSLPTGAVLGYYLEDGIAHVLTRVPVRLALFQRGAWGDPSLNAATGPKLTQHSKLRVLPRKDKSVLVLTRLVSPSQAYLFAQVIAAGGKRLPILPKGSILVKALKRGPAPKTARAQLPHPGSVVVRLRLSGRLLTHGATYTVRVISLDPFGRVATLLLPFTYK